MDITYNVHCRRCLLEGQKCSPCGSGIHYFPRQFGLPHARVLITDLLPYTNYTFDIEALNGVSEMSFGPKQFISVNITTSQVGKTSECFYTDDIAWWTYKIGSILKRLTKPKWFEAGESNSKMCFPMLKKLQNWLKNFFA